MIHLNEFKTFDNVQELNYHVKQHTNRKYHDMNETQRNVLQILSQYSVKYVGASHLRIQTIADKLNKSRRTIERAIRTLIELKVIDRLNTTRKVSGGKGANIYRILPYVASSVSDCEKSAESTQIKDKADKFEKETANLLSYNYSYILETADAVKNAIPDPIFATLSPFFSARELTRLTGVVFRAKTSKVRLENHASEFKSVMLDVIRRYKFDKVKSLDGYMYKAIRKLSRHLYLTSGNVCHV